MLTTDQRLALAGLAEGADTEYAGLHPHLQARLASAQSVMRDLRASMHDNDISMIGITSAQEGIADAFFAAVDKTGAKAQALGYQPRLFWTQPPVDLYEVPGDIIVSVQSSISARASLVWVSFHECDDNGYGDWATASPALIDIYDDLDKAHEALSEISKAVKTIRTVAVKLDAIRSEGATRVKTAPAF